MKYLTESLSAYLAFQPFFSFTFTINVSLLVLLVLLRLLPSLTPILTLNLTHSGQVETNRMIKRETMSNLGKKVIWLRTIYNINNDSSSRYDPELTFC
jgi:hypothetical protein